MINAYSWLYIVGIGSFKIFLIESCVWVTQSKSRYKAWSLGRRYILDTPPIKTCFRLLIITDKTVSRRNKDLFRAMLNQIYRNFCKYNGMYTIFRRWTRYTEIALTNDTLHINSPDKVEYSHWYSDSIVPNLLKLYIYDTYVLLLVTTNIYNTTVFSVLK